MGKVFGQSFLNHMSAACWLCLIKQKSAKLCKCRFLFWKTEIKNELNILLKTLNSNHRASRTYYLYVGIKVIDVEAARVLDRILEQQNFLEEKLGAEALVKILETVGIDDAKANLNIYLEKGKSFFKL